MTGVSYMIPFVAAGGLLIALGFLLGGYEIADAGTATIAGRQHALQPARRRARSASTTPCSTARCSPTSARCFFILGAAAFAFLVPALAGYIAYAIADRPGIAPGFVMGAIAVTASNSGFLGGIVGGVLAGVVAALDRRLEGAHLGARPDAGAGDPAAGDADRRLRDGRRARQAARPR